MSNLLVRTCWILVPVLAWGAGTKGQKPAHIQGPPQILPPQLLLRQERPTYRNYAFQSFVNYANHTQPYDDIPKAYYSSLGNYLITGYPLYEWGETRRVGQEWGSRIFKEKGVGRVIGSWGSVFDSMVLGRDSHDSWSYVAIVGDALIARFSPLTLSKTNFNGIRVDITTPYLKVTGLGSRVERPHGFIPTTPPTWVSDSKTHLADDSTLLLGSRVQAELGALKVGLNWANQHVYESTQLGNSLKGRLRPDQPLVDWIIVRFSDDSPADGLGGAVVHEVQLVVNGEVRPDLRRAVVRHQTGATPQVGTVSQATGKFRPVVYNKPKNKALSFEGSTFYRGREVPLYADYLTLLDHVAGVDVSKTAHLRGLLGSFALESPAEILRADGDEQLIFLFDVSEEPYIESVELEAVLGNDYRAEVAFLHTVGPSGKAYYAEFLSSYYHTVLRARGNVQDLSNLKRVRFELGEHTGHFAYSADVDLRLKSVAIHGEYARSSVYGRYPAHLEQEARFDVSPRFVQRGAAYYVNATRWFGRGRLGGEYFSIHPDFQTEIRTFLDWEQALSLGNLYGLVNQTMYWQLVEDNDDGDRYPDQRFGNLPGLMNDSKGYDIDGVLLGQDEDNDGTLEINRNLNDLADYEEPFLMFDVEPNVYVYGLDRNHNDEPDHREDDGEVDYPYDYDQRGYHFFGQWDLTRYWSLAAGRFTTRQMAGSGRSRSTYALMTYRRESVERLRRLFFENHFRRVRDDIGDEFVANHETPTRDGAWGDQGLTFHSVRTGAFLPPRFTNFFRLDALLYQDSYVNETYVEGWFHPGSTLKLVQKLRLRLNWQQGGPVRPGVVQRQRRLDFWTWVSGTEYTWRWAKWSVTPQYKFMLLHLMDQERNQALRTEIRSIPIVRFAYPLMSRTVLQGGIQGWGPLPYRLEDRATEAAESNSFEQRTAFVTLTNRSRYFGYELVTIIGIHKDKKEFDTPFQDLRSFDTWSFFVRALVGFTEYGRIF